MTPSAAVAPAERGRRSLAIRAGLVALLAVLAGCSGLVPAAPDDEPDRPPYGVEEPLEANATTGNGTATTPNPDYIVPGLTAEGIENASLLVETHFAALERASNGTYVAARNSSTTVNGTRVERTRSRYDVEYPDRWYKSFVTTNDAETVVWETWSTETTLLGRIDRPNESVRYHSGTPDGPPGHPSALERQLTNRLSVASAADTNATVEETRRNGTTWYVLMWQREHDNSPVNRSTTVHIRDDGLIERMDGTTIRETFNGETEITRSRLVFHPYANVTLERPEWYDEAVGGTADDGE